MYASKALPKDSDLGVVHSICSHQSEIPLSEFLKHKMWIKQSLSGDSSWPPGPSVK